jgi:hypothetical protein
VVRHQLVTWIEANGGPLLLLPVDLLPAWDGIRPPADGREIVGRFRWNPEGRPCDYDRACDVDDYIAPIPVGGGHGLVLGDIPAATAWLASADGNGGSLARWVCGPNEGHFLACARSAPPDAFTEPSVTFDVEPRSWCCSTPPNLAWRSTAAHWRSR